MTDRRLHEPADLDRLAFSADGLVPVVAQDAGTGQVLMVAWADRHALARSLETGEMHFWSRSRASLWRKGETSGNTLTVTSLHADCDGDAVLARVGPAGPACHTGDASCFGLESGPEPGVLERLTRLIRDRAERRPEGSYTTRLLVDENLRLKKLGEETAELIHALARRDEEASTAEAADLLFHLLVALEAAGSGLDEVRAVLEARRAGDG
jgi:phosphoribosyl-ATP pyrophosphohydrolase/phosphoribosyl-AMP cyclohydrolase